jgi:hypothetical protein
MNEQIAKSLKDRLMAILMGREQKCDGWLLYPDFLEVARAIEDLQDENRSLRDQITSLRQQVEGMDRP